MKKYLFIFALLTLLLVDNDASAQTAAKPTNEQLKAQITELEKEVGELKSVDELKSDMNDSLLNKEKDNSSKIYNATMLFIAVVSFFVSVGGIAFTYFFNKIAKHQKKIDLVLDSKDFDNKVDAIEQRLSDMNLRVEKNIISNAKRQCKSLCKEIDLIISDVHHAKENNVIEYEELEDILAKHDWNNITRTYIFKKEVFIEIQDTHNYEIVDLFEWFEVLYENFDKISKEMYNQEPVNI
ncbi:MAG: hypothetical protein ACQEW5_09455 [Bacillota bacterium]